MKNIVLAFWKKCNYNHVVGGTVRAVSDEKLNTEKRFLIVQAEQDP